MYDGDGAHHLTSLCPVLVLLVTLTPPSTTSSLPLAGRRSCFADVHPSVVVMGDAPVSLR